VVAASFTIVPGLTGAGEDLHSAQTAMGRFLAALLRAGRRYVGRLTALALQ
jgi:hypothetical protein